MVGGLQINPVLWDLIFFLSVFLLVFLGFILANPFRFAPIWSRLLASFFFAMTMVGLEMIVQGVMTNDVTGRTVLTFNGVWVFSGIPLVLLFGFLL